MRSYERKYITRATEKSLHIISMERKVPYQEPKHTFLGKFDCNDKNKLQLSSPAANDILLLCPVIIII